MENPENPLGLVWGAKAIGEIIGCTERRVFFLIYNGELPIKRKGGRIYTTRAELARLFLEVEAA